ncbi:MAG: helix-hairpin-helix domain-containing protein [Leadbetterella sp.]
MRYWLVSKSEAKGAITFVLVSIFSIVSYKIYSSYSYVKESDSIIESIANRDMFQDDSIQAESRNSYVYSDQNYPPKTVEANFHVFDPNTCTPEELISLGFKPYVVKNIEKYRSKGGKFKNPEDIKKIYGLSPKFYAQVLPYVVIAKSTSDLNKSSKTENSSLETKPFSNTKPSYKPAPIATFDLNTADTNTLKSLPMIGSGYSKRIIKFRDALGGFTSLSQVSQTFGLPVEVMPIIEKYCFIKQPVRKIKLNSAESIKHPYLKPYIAKSIINYRIQHGSFQSLDDLLKVKTMDEETLGKIRPYIEL